MLLPQSGLGWHGQGREVLLRWRGEATRIPNYIPDHRNLLRAPCTLHTNYTPPDRVRSRRPSVDPESNQRGAPAGKKDQRAPPLLLLERSVPRVKRTQSCHGGSATLHCAHTGPRAAVVTLRSGRARGYLYAG